MTVNYCHNCKCHSELTDGVYCDYCLKFFYANNRLPRFTDYVPPATTLETLYSRMGWDAK